MAAPVFDIVGILNIPLGGSWTFDINVQNSPTYARARGELYGFYYGLSGSTLTMGIDLTKVKINNKMWELIAGNDDGEDKIEVTYSIVEGLPVIGVNNIRLPVGAEIDEKIRIANKASAYEVESLLMGLHYSNLDDSVVLDGVIPKSLKEIVDRGELEVLGNDGRIGTVNFTLHDAPSAVENFAFTQTFTRTNPDGIFTFTWDAPVMDGGFPITEYEYRINDSEWQSNGEATKLIAYVGESPFFDDVFNVGPNTFSVRAKNSDGIYGATASRVLNILRAPTIARTFVVSMGLRYAPGQPYAFMPEAIDVYWQDLEPVPPEQTGWAIRMDFLTDTSWTIMNPNRITTGGLSDGTGIVYNIYSWDGIEFVNGLSVFLRVAAVSDGVIGVPSESFWTYIQTTIPAAPNWNTINEYGEDVAYYEGSGDVSPPSILGVPVTRTYTWQSIDRWVFGAWDFIRVREVPEDSTYLSISASLDSDYNLTLSATFTSYRTNLGRRVDFDDISAHVIVEAGHNLGGGRTNGQGFYWEIEE